jgi:N-acetylmuramic acid 6-phosphate etherase
MDLSSASTEQTDPRWAELDLMTPLEAAAAMNAAERRSVDAVASKLHLLAQAASMAAGALRNGGRLIYVGAGTSGRLGVMDAAECPPTFDVEPWQVRGVIAGGAGALTASAESVEDDADAGALEMAALSVGPADLVVAISASGRTPFVLGAASAAKAAGAATVGIANNVPCDLEAIVDLCIGLETGPEVLAGSTRLKAGTAQKMALNIISTVTMVQMGKVYRNLMVDVRPTNEKLRQRAHRIVREATGRDDDAVRAALDASGWRPKVAIVMLEVGCSAAAALDLLAQAGGFVRRAIASPGQPAQCAGSKGDQS